MTDFISQVAAHEVSIGQSTDVSIRPLAENDITQDYADWFADNVVTRHLESRALTVEDCLAFFRQGLSSKQWFMYAIEFIPYGVVGTVKLGPIDYKNGVSDLVAVIGNRSAWGKGLGQFAIRRVTQLAFEEYGLRKLSGAIYSGNRGSIRAYTNAGWVIEGRLRAHQVVDGELQDRVLVSCFNPKLFRTRYGDEASPPRTDGTLRS